MAWKQQRKKGKSWRTTRRHIYENMAMVGIIGIFLLTLALFRTASLPNADAYADLGKSIVVLVFGLIGIYFTFKIGRSCYNELKMQWEVSHNRQRREEHYRAVQTIQHLYTLTPREFELYVGDLYKRLGFEVAVTKQTSDGGVDVHAKKEDKSYVIQAKRFKNGNNVGREVVQQIIGIVAHGHDRAIIATTSDFTHPAYEFARSHPYLRLVNGVQLHDIHQNVYGTRDVELGRYNSRIEDARRD